jgi:prepilin-type N-terminal cleavage/methylation domain-containing protein
MRRKTGFTLIEVIVVVAVLAIVAAVLAPFIAKYVDEWKIAKARKETRAIGEALTNFNRDVGQWPNRNPATGAAVAVLYTGTVSDMTYAKTMVTGSGAGWGGATGNLDNNLLVNGSTGILYPTSGETRWKGPYISSPFPVDPWGRPYLVNVAATGPIWVMSAGPNRRLDTNATDNVVAADDIGFRVR